MVTCKAGFTVLRSLNFNHSYNYKYRATGLCVSTRLGVGVATAAGLGVATRLGVGVATAAGLCVSIRLGVGVATAAGLCVYSYRDQCWDWLSKGTAMIF